MALKRAKFIKSKAKVIKIRHIKNILGGFAIGFINAVFGAGGGIIAVSILKRNGLSQKKAQATALSVILPLSVISAIMYYLNGYFEIRDALSFLPFGFLGTVTGAFLLGKIPDRILKIMFCFFMIYTGVRLLLK